MLWHPKTLQNLAMYNVFFIFGRFSIAGKLPKWPKIPFQYPLALRHPKILEKCRKHHRILVSVRNRFWGLVSVRNRFWPPPAKADIATAILTNVIEHLVLLLPPNKHAFTAKAVWADFRVPLRPLIVHRSQPALWGWNGSASDDQQLHRLQGCADARQWWWVFLGKWVVYTHFIRVLYKHWNIGGWATKLRCDQQRYGAVSLDKNGALKKAKTRKWSAREKSIAVKVLGICYHPAKSPNLGKSQKKLHEQFGR